MRLLFLLLFPSILFSQNFYFGNDLSYVNEMEDCGVVYQENNNPKDPFQIFADKGSNLIRLRLWHTPSWYDDLNNGQRYSDFQDVKKSIQRAKDAGMEVLLDFHLSDNWADPSKQLVPEAWLSVVDDLPVLKDSLHNYIFQTLSILNSENLLPEMVQIGNETNKGILLSPDDNAVWTLDWPRNAELFNTAIQAVKEVESASGKEIDIALHIAGPDNISWLLPEFVANGVTDFEVIGMSYYWTWHQPATISEVGELIAELKNNYPGKKVMIFETSYPWTDDWNDNANNIATELNTAYSPASPQAQKDWMIDLTEAVMSNGGDGIIYWEPAWVSSGCWTQWGEGSHGEHLAFFDFENNLIENGGISWMSHDYVSSSSEEEVLESFKMWTSDDDSLLHISVPNEMATADFQIKLINAEGKNIFASKATGNSSVTLPKLNAGIYFAFLYNENKLVFEEKLFFQD